jgi:hypothetical protein
MDAAGFLDALLWTFIGIAFVKTVVFPYKERPTIKEWLRDNFIDIVRGVVFTMVFTKLGTVSFEILADQFDMSINILDKLEGYNLDESQLYLTTSIIFQGFLASRH